MEAVDTDSQAIQHREQNREHRQRIKAKRWCIFWIVLAVTLLVGLMIGIIALEVIYFTEGADVKQSQIDEGQTDGSVPEVTPPGPPGPDWTVQPRTTHKVVAIVTKMAATTTKMAASTLPPSGGERRSVLPPGVDRLPELSADLPIQDDYNPSQNQESDSDQEETPFLRSHRPDLTPRPGLTQFGAAGRRPAIQAAENSDKTTVPPTSPLPPSNKRTLSTTTMSYIDAVELDKQRIQNIIVYLIGTLFVVGLFLVVCTIMAAKGVFHRKGCSLFRNCCYLRSNREVASNRNSVQQEIQMDDLTRSHGRSHGRSNGRSHDHRRTNHRRSSGSSGSDSSSGSEISMETMFQAPPPYSLAINFPVPHVTYSTRQAHPVSLTTASGRPVPSIAMVARQPHINVAMEMDDESPSSSLPTYEEAVATSYI